MGLFSSFCRAVGRAVGRGVETVGKIIHSEKIQESDVIFKMLAAKRHRIPADSTNTIKTRQQSEKHSRLQIFCRAFRLASTVRPVRLK